MNTKFRFIFALLCCTSLSVGAETYICVVAGKPYYTTVKTGNQCHLSYINSTAPIPIDEPPVVSTQSASEPSVPQIINDEIDRIWNQSEYGSFDDTVILPPTPQVDTPRETKNPNAGKVGNTTVRHQPKTHTHSQTAKAVAMPPKTVPLTRRQVLQNEINREKAALRTAQMQLNAAQKAGNSKSVTRLTALVNDRQQNLLALEAEMRK